jgi:hypothetical protein
MPLCAARIFLERVRLARYSKDRNSLQSIHHGSRALVHSSPPSLRGRNLRVLRRNIFPTDVRFIFVHRGMQVLRIQERGNVHACSLHCFSTHTSFTPWSFSQPHGLDGWYTCSPQPACAQRLGTFLRNVILFLEIVIGPMRSGEMIFTRAWSTTDVSSFFRYFTVLLSPTPHH